MAYRDIVMGTNGETSPLSQLPFAYFAMDVAEPVPNIGLSTDKSLDDAAIAYDPESLTFDNSGAPNSAGSLRFTNGGDQLQNYNALRVTMEQYSVAAWIKPDIPANALLTATSIFQHYNNPNGMILGILPGGGLLYGYHRSAANGDGATALGGAIVNGQRDFVVGTVHRLSGRVRFYRNGQLVQESPMTVGNAQTAGSSTQRIGRGASTKFGQPGFSTAQTFGNYSGLMAHLMIWRDYEVTPAEVAALYAAGVGPATAPIELTNLAPGSRFRIERAADQSLIVEGVAATDTYQTTVPFTGPVAVVVKVRSSSAPPRYRPFTTGGTITATGLSVFVSQELDPVLA